MQGWFGLPDDWGYAWIFPFFFLFQYTFVYATAFFMDALVCQILAIEEHVNPIRNFIHFVCSQPVLWTYCLVEYKAIIEIAVFGKKVCGHKASDKSALLKPAALDDSNGSSTDTMNSSASMREQENGRSVESGCGQRNFF